MNFNTSVEDFPFMVSIEEVTYTNIYICSGIIISRNYVLTSARCFYDENFTLKNLFIVRAGSSYVEQNGSIHTVAEIISHNVDYPFNSDKALLYNIALIKVTEPFDKKYQPVGILKSPENFNSSKSAVLTGWGKVLEKHHLKLQGINVALVRNCSMSFLNTDEIDCEDGSFGIEGTDSCFGDSGGFVTINGSLYGMILYTSCALELTNSVFIDLSRFSDWILSRVPELK